jgi:hypothetical protein
VSKELALKMATFVCANRGHHQQVWPHNEPKPVHLPCSWCEKIADAMQVYARAQRRENSRKVRKLLEEEHGG